MSAESVVNIASLPSNFDPALLQITEYSATAASIVIVWEACLTLGDEVTYIWPKPRNAHVKWLYLYGKYFAILTQIGNIAFLFGLAEHLPVPIGWCRAYHSFQVATLELLMLAFDAVLLLRIYALYARKLTAVSLGATVVIVEFITTITSAGVAIPATPYDPACLIFNMPTSIIVFMVGFGVSQTILLILAYRKKAVVTRADRQRTSIAWITIRDGMLAFAGISGLLVMLLIYLVVDPQFANLTI
ncbi:hypothetical protein F5I97DRAFT_1826991 [Phlebopus sp. FC_14]|nr:hypothetical protein F5I97DRAFT_1826991 [Phlebopus sp. FC_14]